METNLVKQPKPDIQKAAQANTKSSEGQKAPARKLNRPYVGVIDVPNISKTPISDTLVLKEQENPHTIYKLSSKRGGKFSINEAISLAVGALGFVCYFNILRDIVKGISKKP